MDFRDLTEQQLKTILRFTEALADTQPEKQINFADMRTTDELLTEAEQSAKNYAAKRKRQASFSDDELPADDETDEDGSIRARIREYYRRTRKIVKG